MITTFTSPSESTCQNRIAEHVFNRFGIDPRATDKIYENTALIEVNPDFLVDVLNVFSRNQDIDYSVFEKYSVPVLVDYLLRSHSYYLEKILPEIGQSIAILLGNYNEKSALLEILYRFYFSYKTDLQEHFIEEEELLFPYANQLYKAVYFKTEIDFFTSFLQEYSINDFVENHADTEEELINIRNILSEYDPPSTNRTSFRILIEQLKNFEHDLEIHAFIEDRVLVPKLVQLEQNLRFEINN